MIDTSDTPKQYNGMIVPEATYILALENRIVELAKEKCEYDDRRREAMRYAENMRLDARRMTKIANDMAVFISENVKDFPLLAGVGSPGRWFEYFESRIDDTD